MIRKWLLQDQGQGQQLAWLAAPCPARHWSGHCQALPKQGRHTTLHPEATRRNKNNKKFVFQMTACVLAMVFVYVTSALKANAITHCTYWNYWIYSKKQCCERNNRANLRYLASLVRILSRVYVQWSQSHRASLDFLIERKSLNTALWIWRVKCRLQVTLLHAWANSGRVILSMLLCKLQLSAKLWKTSSISKTYVQILLFCCVSFKPNLGNKWL